MDDGPEGAPVAPPDQPARDEARDRRAHQPARTPRETYLGFLRHRKRGPTATAAVPGWIRWGGILILTQLALWLAAAALELVLGPRGATEGVGLLLTALFVALGAAATGRYLSWASERWLARDAQGARHSMGVALLLLLLGVVAFVGGVHTLTSTQPEGARLAVVAARTLLGLVMAHASVMVVLNRNKSLAAKRVAA